MDAGARRTAELRFADEVSGARGAVELRAAARGGDRWELRMEWRRPPIDGEGPAQVFVTVAAQLPGCTAEQAGERLMDLAVEAANLAGERTTIARLVSGGA